MTEASSTVNGTDTPVGDLANEANLAAAETAKEHANQAFKDRHYAQAIAGYTKAITLNPGSAVYYGNRSIANLRLENYGSAVTDATEALAIDPTYTKGLYRRADAYFAMGKYKEALKDFKAAAKMAPRDPDVRRKLAEAEKTVKRLKFEEALATPEAELLPVSERVDLSLYPVEDSYAGPRMQGNESEGYSITQEFVTAMVETFREQKNIHKRFVFHIVLEAQRILRSLPSLVHVSIPNDDKFTVCGDVHGQYYDLLNIFKMNGYPSPTNAYLFNGDFVDRGSFSVETILTLFAYKCLYPQHVHLARGNHESVAMNRIYGFDGEVNAKYKAANLLDLFRETFRWLPLAHVLNNKVFVVHGGLFSRDGVKLSELETIDRNREPPDEGPMCEMLWSDPSPLPGRQPSKRGTGVAFGADVTKRFLKDNDLQLLVRSHEVKDDGYEVDHDGYCITVFSAPNYCDQMGNKGAFISFKGSDMVPHFTTYDAVHHPDVKAMAYAAPMLGSMFGFM